MSREDRSKDELRNTTITPSYLDNPDGSALIECGKTKVICTAMIDESLPPWIEGDDEKDHGWLTGRYGMLPGSGDTRIRRERRGAKGRTKEIQRLLGRSLRAALDLGKIGERTIWIDSDVIQADGGTRTASITGGWVALKLAVDKMLEEDMIEEDPFERQIAAVSAGLVDGEILLDLPFEEDSSADVDMNVVMDSGENFIEIQATGEESVFTKDEHIKMLELTTKGIQELIEIQNEALKEV